MKKCRMNVLGRTVRNSFVQRPNNFSAIPNVTVSGEGKNMENGKQHTGKE